MSILPEPKARRPSSSRLTEPLLGNRNNKKDDKIKEDTFINKYFGTDTQKSSLFLALSALIYNIDTLIRLIMQHFGDRIDLIIYMLGLTLISYGAYKGYICSSPNNILYTAFYPGQSIHPLKDNWFNIHLGTGLLISSQAILLGSVIYLLASIIELIESFIISYNIAYSSSICNIIGGILIVISSYYNNIATYPENMLRPFDPQIVEYLEKNNKQWLIRHIGTDMQMASWSLLITSIIWFIISAISFDYFTPPECGIPYFTVLNLICSILLGISGYYSLRQSYNEGTKFDTLLVNVFNNVPNKMKDDEDDDIIDLEKGNSSSSIGGGGGGGGVKISSMVDVVVDDEEHPLNNINNRDIVGLVDMQDVINESYAYINNNNWYCDETTDEEPVIHKLTTTIIGSASAAVGNSKLIHNDLASSSHTDNISNNNDEDILIPPPPPPPGGIESVTETTKIWYYRNNNNAVKCSDILNGIDALLVAAVLQSKEFKQSVIGDSDIGKVSIIDEPDGKTFIYYERHPPDPPMPLCESTYCSHIGIPYNSEEDDEEEEESLILVEWGIATTTTTTQASASAVGTATYNVSNRYGNIIDPKAARVDPYRVYYLTSLPGGKTKITSALYITIPHNNNKTPQFLINEELRKAPEIFADLKVFLNDEEAMVQVIGDLEFRIWQDIHRRITPLLAGVLVRASPAYRSMIATFPGLRAKVPMSIPVYMHSRYMSSVIRYNEEEEEGDIHPLHNTPVTLCDAITDDGILKACSIGLQFISNEYEDWILTNNNNTNNSILHNPFNKQQQQRNPFKLNIWRRKLKGESIDPYRMQCKIQGIDPLTLATIWWSNEGKFRTINKEYTGIESIKDVTPASVASAAPLNGGVGGSDDNIKVYNEILKGHGTMRKRECNIITIIKELSATKVMVIDYSVVLSNILPNNNKSSLVHVNIFNVYIFENDSGANTKITIAGLVPFGGKTEKLKLKIMAEQEVKSQEHFMTFMYNYFTDTPEGRLLVTNTRTKILGKVWQPILCGGLTKLQLQFLRANSDAFNMLLNEDDHINSITSSSSTTAVAAGGAGSARRRNKENNGDDKHIGKASAAAAASSSAAMSSSVSRLTNKDNIVNQGVLPRKIRSRQTTGDNSIIMRNNNNGINDDNNREKKDKVCSVM